MSELFCAADFETFYDSKNSYGLKSQTMWEYTHDEKFDAFLVSVFGFGAGGEPLEFCGSPLAFDWSKLEGVTLVCHNASFDGLVLARLRELGKVTCGDHEFVDTADLAAYLRAPRNLKGAAKTLLGVEMSKAVRSSMDGQRFRELTPSVRAEWIKYAGLDAELTYKLWDKYGSQWPATERAISKYNREAGWRGVAVDREALEAGKAQLFLTLREAEKNMPWIADGDQPGSGPGLRRYARSVGLDDVPPSLKRDDPQMVSWVEKHKDQHAFIQAKLDHASATPHFARLNSMAKLLDDENVIRFDTLYHGAGTGRITASSQAKAGTESSSTRFNPLNIPRAPVFGVDIRGMLVPRAGYKFIVHDYAQVEPRLEHWLSGNTEFIESIKTDNIYQATAKLMGWFPKDATGLKKADPELYRFCKILSLGLGYGMGHKKFRQTCAKNGIFIDEKKARETVAQWRELNPKIVNLWHYHNDRLRTSAKRHDAEHTVMLPSWRKLTYFGPEERQGTMMWVNEETGETEPKQIVELFASPWRHIEPTKIYGGRIVENIIQSTARDIMYAAQVKLSQEHPSWFFLWNAYDETIFEVPTNEAEDASREIAYWMCNAAEWAKGCPLEVEGGIFDRYMK